MSDLFTKAANVKTTTKLWIVGIALLVMVSIPYTDDHYQPSPVAAPISHPTAVTPATTQAVPRVRPLATTNIPAQSGAQPIPSSSVAGDYTGTVHNATAAVSAEFSVLLEESKGALSGSMTVKPPLYGSGPLQGSTSGADVAFTVTSSTGKIVFTGSRIKRSITGTYTVAQPSGGIETGTFTLDRASRAKRAPAAAAQEEPTAAPATLPDVRPSEPLPVAPISSHSIQEHSDPKNLSNCLYGMPSCNRSLLTEKEQAAVAESARKRNLSNCIYGMPICDHRSLTESEQAAVAESARKRNLSNCIYGMPACDRRSLTDQEQATVAESARKRNLSNCMYGMPACDRRPLTDTEQAAVAESARKRNLSNCLYKMPTCNPGLLTPAELVQVQAKNR